jgi:multiple sugar transport system permease protein
MSRARKSLVGFAFLSPNLIGFLVFMFFPVIASLVLSFTTYDLVNPPKLTGLDNFADLLFGDQSEQFYQAAWNTVFLMFGIPVSILGSLFLAMVLNQKFRGMVFFRTVFFLPTICAGIAVLMLWRWLLHDNGLLNALLAQVGSSGPRWLNDPKWIRPAIILMGTWASVGGINMILYLAALSNVSPELYEAADIDGAGTWRKFWAITWPMVSPTTFFIGVMSVIRGFQAGFEAAMIIADGPGPGGATRFLSYFIYERAFVHYRMGLASSAAWLMFLAVLVLTLMNWRFGGRRVIY